MYIRDQLESAPALDVLNVTSPGMPRVAFLPSRDMITAAVLYILP